MSELVDQLLVVNLEYVLNVYISA